MTAELLVVGGGAAGHGAVRAFRDSGGVGPVVMLSADDQLPYNRPPLSKDYLRGESESTELPLESPGFYPDHDVEVLLSETATRLDPHNRVVRTQSGLEVGYRQCIIATGSAPAELAVPGAETAMNLRLFRHAALLRDRAQVGSTALVVGSGFIGCEAAVSLAARGLRVTMISTEQQPQLDRLGADAARLITAWLESAGIEFIGGAQIASVTAGRLVQLADGSHHRADLILSAVGAVPQTAWLEHSGIEIGDGRIVVDDSMRTSVDGVFAAGDAVSAFNTAAGRHLAVEHWGDADTMGMVAGTVAGGGRSTWSTPPGFWSEIGAHTLKYAAWGDGYDSARPVAHEDGGLTIWYTTDGATVGVLTHNADDDYEKGIELISAGAAPAS